MYIPGLFVHPGPLPTAEGGGGDPEPYWQLAMVLGINQKDRSEDLGSRDSTQEFPGNAENGTLFRNIASTVGMTLRSCSPGTALGLCS